MRRTEVNIGKKKLSRLWETGELTKLEPEPKAEKLKRSTADFCTEIEHWQWRVAAAIGNPRRRHIPEAIGRVAFGMSINGGLSPPLPAGPCKNPPWKRRNAETGD